MTAPTITRTQTTTAIGSTEIDLLPGATAGLDLVGRDAVQCSMLGGDADVTCKVYTAAYNAADGSGTAGTPRLLASFTLAAATPGVLNIRGYMGGPLRITATAAAGSVGIVAQLAAVQNAVPAGFQINWNGTDIQDTATGVNAAIDAGHAAASSAGAITCATETAVESFISPREKADAVHAQDAGGGALNLIAGFTTAFPSRNITMKRGGAGAPTIYTVTGTRLGAVQTETFTSSGASDIVGAKVWDTHVSITSNVDPTVTTDFVTGDLIGLPRVATLILRGGVAATAAANYVIETFTLNALKDAFTPTTVPDHVKCYRVQYSYLPTATQGTHTHTLTHT